jgi:hypothetical protein
MNKLKVDFKKNKHDEDLKKFENTKKELQKIITDIKGLELNITIENTDLDKLINSPKMFFCDKIVNESIKVNGIKLNKEKIFDLMEIPEDINNIIEYIIRLKNDIIAGKQSLYIENLNNDFTIINNKINISENALSELKEIHTIYLDNENQIKIFNLLTEIKEKIKAIKEIDPRYYNIEDLFDDYYKLMGNNNFLIDIDYIKRFRE